LGLSGDPAKVIVKVWYSKKHLGVKLNGVEYLNIKFIEYGGNSVYDQILCHVVMG